VNPGNRGAACTAFVALDIGFRRYEEFFAASCHSRECGNPVVTILGGPSPQGLLDCPVKPGNDKENGHSGESRNPEVACTAFVILDTGFRRYDVKPRHLNRHPEVRAQRASKDDNSGASFEGRFAAASG